MRILYTTSTTELDGSSLSLLSLLDSVIAHGDTPFVVVPDASGPLCEKLQQKSIQYFKIPLTFFCYPSPRPYGKIWFFFDIKNILKTEYKAERNLSKIISQVKPDLIHTNVGPIVTGHFVAKKHKIPHIWHIREYGDLDFNLHFFPSKKIFHKLLNQDAVISITHDLIQYNELENNKKAFVIYNGVREKNNIHYLFPKSKFFLCASRVSPEKGHVETILTFSKFHQSHPEYKLIILGKGNKQFIDYLKDLSKEHSCSDAVVFQGFTANVADYMKNATALLVGSYFEGFGRMTAEASFDGCIVIGKNSGGTREIISQTGGFLYNTQEEMLAFMEDVANFTEEKYYSIAKKAQQVAQNLFSIENYTEKIYSIYTKILKLRNSIKYTKKL